MNTLNPNHIHRSLLCHYNQNINPHTSIGGTSSQLEKISKNLSQAPSSPLVFTTGIGLSDIGVPLRIPAILIPTLQVMRRLRDLGILNVSYRLYQATDFIISENGLDRGNAEKVASIMGKYISNYIQDNYPELESAIDLQFSIDLPADSVARVAGELEKIGHPSLQRLSQYAESKGKSVQSAFRYAAANIICNGHIPEVYPMRLKDDVSVMVVGGAKEKPFFELGKYYEKSVLGILSGPIPLIQSTGVIPTYYPQRGEAYMDPTGKICPADSNVSLHPSIQSDLKLVNISL